MSIFEKVEKHINKEMKKKKDIAKKMKTYKGRPIEELKKEAGIGKYKSRYDR